MLAGFDLDQIQDLEGARQAIALLLNLVETLKQENQELQEEIQRLRDKIGMRKEIIIPSLVLPPDHNPADSEHSCTIPGPDHSPGRASGIFIFFQALAPAHLDALAAILEAQQTERQRLVQQWEEKVKRAQYEAHRAERQYQAVDPENRLVAAELERRWEATLHQLRAAREAFEQFQQQAAPLRLTPELRQQFQRVSESLPSLWPHLSNAQKKELLRTLIAQVVLHQEAPDRVAVKVVWISGHYTLIYVQPLILRQEDVTWYNEMVQCIQELWKGGLSNEQIAAQLTEEGFHTARSTGVTPIAVQKIRLAQG